MRFCAAHGGAAEGRSGRLEDSRVGECCGCLYNRRSDVPRACRASMVRLLTPNDYRSMPWKNGAGRTTEIAVHPAGAALDAFAWRVSIADVERDGPFSRFPGIDRTIVLLDGARNASCAPDGAIRELTTRFAPHDFSGDDAIDCTLVAGPVPRFQRDVPARPRARQRRGRARMRRAQFEPRSSIACRTRRRGARMPVCPDMPPHRLDGGSCAARRRDRRRRRDAAPIVVRAARRRMPWRSSSASIADETLRRRRADAATAGCATSRSTSPTTERSSGSKTHGAARWRRARGRPARAGDAQPPFARVPARDRRAHRTRERGRRQLLDLAAGDVRVPRPDRCRRVRGDRRASLCRDAEGGVYARWPNSTTCITIRRASPMPIPRSSRAASSPPPAPPGSRSRCCRCSTRIPISAARRRRRASGGSCIRSTPMRDLVATLARDARERDMECRRCAAQPARRDAGGAVRDRCAAAASIARPHSRRRAGARGRGLRRMERGAARSNGCSTMRTSTRAGASCTRRT